MSDCERSLARQRPPRADPVSDAPLAQAVREGWITPAALPPEAPPPAPPDGVMSLEEVLADLDHSREDGATGSDDEDRASQAGLR